MEGAPTPFIPNTGADRDAILAYLGLDGTEALFADLPSALRDPTLDLPEALAEQDLAAYFEGLADANARTHLRPSFLGAGAYRRFVPAITSHLASRSEFATAYTPYQPEISQGTLQAAFEFQATVCALTGMEIANTGLYDVASATAEGCLLAKRVNRRDSVALLEPLDPGIARVIGTYAFGADLEVRPVASIEEVTAEDVCVVVQQPDFLGAIRDLEPLAMAAHERGALLVVVADPVALGLLRAPGEAGADIVTGEGRDLAGPLNFGGPSLGLFATRDSLRRQIPGRIVGRAPELATSDGGARGTGYVLTLQAREQFIRRERATSNFSTGQALLALGFTITVQALGPEGLRRLAELCYQKAHDAAGRIGALSGYRVRERGPWFQEFLVHGPVPAHELRARLQERGIEPGLDVSSRPEPEAEEALLFCVTELTTPEEVGQLVTVLAAIGESA